MRISSGDALKRAQIKPIVLEAKESISLINGTQAMLAVGTLALLAAETLVDSADVLGGLCCDALKGTDTAFDERIHKARPHSGQIKTAANLRKMLEGSQIRESHRACGRVQDAYSLRCIPQVHGAVHLRDAAEGISVLYTAACAVRFANLAAFEHLAKIRCRLDLSTVRAGFVDALVESRIGAFQRVAAESAQHVGRIDQRFRS